MPTQLIEPFDREVRRVSRPRRNDGISDDGLSYRRADDFGSLWGDALADYEARTGTGQRSVPLTQSDIDKGFIARVESARPTEQYLTDNPRVAAPISDPAEVDALRHQLFDPLTQRFGSDSQTITRRTPNQLVREVGNDVYQIDPVTGRSTKIIDTPDRPDTRGDSFERSVILGKINMLRQLQANPMDMRLSGKTPEQIDADIAALEDQGRQIFHKETPAAITKNAPQSRTPQGFIGNKDELRNPLGENQFLLPESGKMFMGDRLGKNNLIRSNPETGELPTVTTEAQFKSLPPGAIYIGKNGKRHKKP